MKNRDQAGDETRRQRIAELAGQLESHGLASDAAERIAREEVGTTGEDPAGSAARSWIVAPHAQGWLVTRVNPLTGNEIFADLDAAERRATELGAADDAPVMVCDSHGRRLRRLRHSAKYWRSAGTGCRDRRRF